MHPLGLAIKRFFTPTFKIPFTTTKGDIDDENAKLEILPTRRHFDIVIACEDDEGNDVQI